MSAAMLPPAPAPTKPPAFPAQPPPRLVEIVELVSDFYGIPVREVRGPNRRKSRVRARHVAMFLARRYTKKSFEEIGTFFGSRDHSTTLYGVRAVEQALANDTEMPAVIAWFNAKLLSAPDPRQAATTEAA